MFVGILTTPRELGDSRGKRYLLVVFYTNKHNNFTDYVLTIQDIHDIRHCTIPIHHHHLVDDSHVQMFVFHRLDKLLGL